MVVPIGSFWFWGEFFQFLVTFLLAFAMLYGLLVKTKHLGERPDINAVVAFALSMLVALSGVASLIVKLIPYAAVIMLVLFVIFLSGKFLGVDTDEWVRSRYFSVGIILLFLAIITVLAAQDYSKSMQVELTLLENQTNVTQLNKTGNFIIDTKALYNYQCVEKQVFSGPSSRALPICILLNPRFLGAALILSITAVFTAFVMRGKES